MVAGETGVLIIHALETVAVVIRPVTEVAAIRIRHLEELIVLEAVQNPSHVILGPVQLAVVGPGGRLYFLAPQLAVEASDIIYEDVPILGQRMVAAGTLGVTTIILDATDSLVQDRRMNFGSERKICLPTRRIGLFITPNRL